MFLRFDQRIKSLPMDDVKLSPELRRRIVEAVLNGPRERERQRQLTIIDRVADLLTRVPDPEAEKWLDEMSRLEADPKLLAQIRLARATKLLPPSDNVHSILAPPKPD
jgi:hypothetical protein